MYHSSRVQHNYSIDFFTALFHFGEMPNIFRNLKVSTLIALLKDDTNAQSIFSLIFEKTCRDLNEVNANVLEESIALLQQFSNNEDSEQKILLQIAVLIVCDLSKDKKNRAHCDRFRDILFEIIVNASKQTDSMDWLINVTLPAFILIVKAHVDANKSAATSETNNSKEITKLMKIYLKNTVTSHSKNLSFNLFSAKYYSIGIIFRSIQKISFL